MWKLPVQTLISNRMHALFGKFEKADAVKNTEHHKIAINGPCLKTNKLNMFVIE